MTPDPPRAYRLVGLDPTGLGLGGRPLSRLAGRERELLALERLLERAAAGAGQAVVLMGEPGVGKSRVLYELRQRIAASGTRWIEGRSASAAVATPYGPVAAALRHAFGVSEDAAAATVAAATREQLKALGLDAHSQFLEALLGLPEAVSQVSPLTPEVVRHRTFDALHRFFLGLSLGRPLVLAVEDIHWIDPTSEAWLTPFVDRLAGARVLLLATSRPGHAAPWLTRSHASQLALPPLSREDSLVVVRSIASADRLSDTTASSIAARADGNPFFLEELSWAALTQGADAVTRVAPRSVTDVLRARIDRLADATRQVLTAAAVLGRELPVTLLQAVAPDPDRLDAELAELKRLELLHDQAQATEPTLLFKHALTQEVAYAGLAERDRQALHRAAAVAIERLHADHPTAVPRLAHHYARARHPAKAIEYLVRLAEQTQRAYAVKDCVAALGEALRFAEQLPEGPERDRCIVGLVARHALPMAFLGAYPDAITLFRSHEALAERLGDDPVAGAFYVWLGHTYDQIGQHALARPAAERALAIASRHNDRTTMGTAHYVLSLEDFWAGRYRSGIEHGQAAIRVLDPTSESWMVGQSSWTWSINAVLLADLTSAREACARVEAVAGATEDPRLQSYAAWVRGWVALVEDDAATAVAACRRALDIAPDPLSRAVALQWIGLACQDSGRPAEATPPLQEAIEQYRLFRFAELEAWSLALLAEAALGSGRVDEARDLALRAQALASQSRFRYATGLAQRALGRAARSRGALPEANRHLDEAIAVFRAIEARWELGRTLLDAAAVAQASGQGAVAAGHLDEARRLFREVGVPRWVARGDALARELSGSGS